MKPTTMSQRDGEGYRRFESTADDHSKKNDLPTQPRKKCYLLISLIYLVMVIVAIVFLYDLIVLDPAYGYSHKSNYLGVICNFFNILLFSLMLWKM